ncbi:unnamed protein product [Urochloa humidicola]
MVNTRASGSAAPPPPPPPPTMEELVRMQTQLMQTMAQSMAMMQQNQQNQPPAGPIRVRRAEFMRGSPPKFSHASNPLQADDWLKAVERQLDIAQCTDREKVLYASGQLEGAALAWWESQQFGQANRNQITWQQFRDSFRTHHVPAGLMKLKMKEFRALKQEGMSVTAYRDKFLELARYAPDDVTTDAQKQERFRDGLTDIIQYQMMCVTFPTFGALVDGALMIEHKRQEMEDKQRKFMSQQTGGNTRPRFKPQPTNQLGNQQRFQGQSSLLNRNQFQQRPQYPPPQQQQMQRQQPRLQGQQQNNQAPHPNMPNNAPAGQR